MRKGGALTGVGGVGRGAGDLLSKWVLWATGEGVNDEGDLRALSDLHRASLQMDLGP